MFSGLTWDLLRGICYVSGGFTMAMDMFVGGLFWTSIFLLALPTLIILGTVGVLWALDRWMS